MGVIGFRKAKCKDCYKCVRLCEVKAIRIKDEHAQFVASECVECGQCLEACPQNAITFIKDILPPSGSDLHLQIHPGTPAPEIQQSSPGSSPWT